MKQQNPLATPLVDNVRWYIKLRWLYIGSLGLTWLGGQIALVGEDSTLDDDVSLVFVGLFVNFIFYLLARRENKSSPYYYRLALAQLATDITTASLVLYAHGGGEARTSILYAIPVFIAGALFGNLTLLITILGSAIAYDFTVVLHAYQVPDAEGISRSTVVRMAFYNTVFLMIGLVAKHSLDKTTDTLKRQNDELVAFNESKDEFISIASHQLRTPATAVKQYTGMLLQGYFGDLTKKQHETLDKAYTSNERQLKIVNDLLQVAQLDSEKMKIRTKKQDIGKLVKDVIEEQTAEFATRRQKILLTLPPKPVMVSYDSSLMRMAMENVINNAGKYSKTGKKVKVWVKPRRNEVDIVVADKGVGLSRSEQKKLFQKFSRIYNPFTESASGSGLGLYWTKKIINLHNGEIAIDSQKGTGSTFVITLPKRTKRWPAV